jgi:ABC-type amino acid transport substrate-binding protein
VRDLVTDIESWTDVQQRRLPFAILANSTVERYFSNNTDPDVRGMLTHARQYDNLDDAVSALRTGVVEAFIAESITIKYARLFPPW